VFYNKTLFLWYNLNGDNMEKVYFIRNITSKNIVKLYKLLNKELTNVAVKVHSGEDGNQNYLRPEFLKDIIDYVDGTVVETNTAYEGARNTSEKHKELIKKHKWDMYKFDLLDEKEDITFNIPNGKTIKEVYVGKNIEKYDSMLVISHFKGHPMGGYGGALKQLSIGCASSRGKCYIHSAGVTDDTSKVWRNASGQDKFLESMADAASSIVNYFKGNMAFINIMCNISRDCDCCSVAEDPCMKDIGILASLDPVAIDQASIDLVINSDDPGKEKLLERINSRNGTYVIDSAEKLGIGSKNYELIEVDENI